MHSNCFGYFDEDEDGAPRPGATVVATVPARSVNDNAAAPVVSRWSAAPPPGFLAGEGVRPPRSSYGNPFGAPDDAD
jgi:hypothetical protein